MHPVSTVLNYCDCLTFPELCNVEEGIYRKKCKRVRENLDQVRRELDEHDRDHPDDFLSLLLS